MPKKTPKDNNQAKFSLSKQDFFVDSVREMMVSLNGGVALNDSHANKVARFFYESQRVKRILGDVESKFDLSSERDELLQGVIMVLFEKMIPVLDVAENIYSVIYATAERVALGLKRSLITKSGRFESFSSYEGGEDGMEEVVFTHDGIDMINVDSDFFERLDEEIDRKKALSEIDKRLDGAVLDMVHPQKATSVSEEVSPKRVLCSDAAELAQIRVDLDLSSKEMASAVGVQHATLCAYLYGRTKAVPANVMSTARNLLQERGHIRIKLEEKFGEKPMKELVNDWCLKLNIDPMNIEVVAKAFGVNSITIDRWYTNQTRPTLRQIQGYDRRFASLTSAN